MLIIIFALFLFLFFGAFSVLMLRSALSSIIRKKRKEHNATFLSCKEMFWHIFLGTISAVISLAMLMAAIVSAFGPPQDIPK